MLYLSTLNVLFLFFLFCIITPQNFFVNNKSTFKCIVHTSVQLWYDWHFVSESTSTNVKQILLPSYKGAERTLSLLLIWKSNLLLSCNIGERGHTCTFVTCFTNKSVSLLYPNEKSEVQHCSS